MTSPIQIQIAGAKSQAMVPQRPHSPTADPTGASFEDHVAISPVAISDNWQDGSKGEAGEGPGAADSGDLDGEAGKTAVAQGDEIPEGSSESDMKSLVGAADPVPIDLGPQITNRSGYLASHARNSDEVEHAMIGVHLKDLPNGASENGAESYRFTDNEVTLADPRAQNSIPAVLPEAVTRFKLSGTDESGKAGSGDLGLEPPEWMRHAQGASFLVGRGSDAGEFTNTERQLTGGADVQERLGSYSLSSVPGQRHPNLASELQIGLGSGRSVVPELSEQFMTHAMEAADAALVRQFARVPGSIRVAEASGQITRASQNPQISRQVKPDLQGLAATSRLRDGLASEIFQNASMPMAEIAAQHVSPLIAPTAALNLFSGASLVGVGGFGPAQPLVPQIVDAIGKSSSGAILVALSPRELGRVRMSLMASETGFVASIAAERAETIDIMRRHSEVLVDELRRFGFENADLEFSHGGSNFNQGSGDDALLVSTDTNQEQVPQTPQNHQGQARNPTGLDMRI